MNSSLSKRVAIRVDASIQIGSGHVMRCLTLADTLSRQGAAIVFVCREHAGNLCGLIEKRGFKVLRLPRRDDVDSFAWNRHARWLQTTRETDAQETLAALHDY